MRAFYRYKWSATSFLLLCRRLWAEMMARCYNTHTRPWHPSTHPEMLTAAPTCPKTESTMGSRSTGSPFPASFSLLCGPCIISSSVSSSVLWSSATCGLWLGLWWRWGWDGAIWMSPLPTPSSLVLFLCFSTFFLMAACTWRNRGAWLCFSQITGAKHAYQLIVRFHWLSSINQ